MGYRRNGGICAKMEIGRGAGTAVSGPFVRYAKGM